MAADATRLVLGAQPEAITHPDADYQTGRTFIARCDAATVYYGGEDVTTATGYSKGPTVEFGASNTTDTVYAVVDPADAGAELQVFWLGV